MNSLPQRIYVDNAATSWPKPEAVYQAVDHYQRQLGAPAGRSAYREAAEVERLIGDARRRIAELIGAPRPQQVIFTTNGTDSLNLALRGMLRAGDHVITTVVEHNSVLRPLRQLESDLGIEVTRVDCGPSGIIDSDDVRRAIRPATRMLSVIHASNVSGALQPIAEIGRLAADAGLVVLADAAQTLGHVPIDVRELGVHLLAAPGHKGLLGPLGTGVLYVDSELEPALRPIRQGGTGTHSESDHQPHSLPDGYEPGNHNVPGIIGLRAGVAYVTERGVESIRDHDVHLTSRLLTGFSEIDGVTVFGPSDAAQRVGVVSITIDGYDPQEVATMLDAAHSIQVRSGLHCAPLAHAALGTFRQGGTVRFSLGPFNTSAQIDLAIQAVAEIAASNSLT